MSHHLHFVERLGRVKLSLEVLWEWSMLQRSGGLRIPAQSAAARAKWRGHETLESRLSAH